MRKPRFVLDYNAANFMIKNIHIQWDLTQIKWGRILTVYKILNSSTKSSQLECFQTKNIYFQTSQLDNFKKKFYYFMFGSDGMFSVKYLYWDRAYWNMYKTGST